VPQPPRSSTVADAPTSELGALSRSIAISPGLFGGGGAVIEERERQRDLAWPRSVDTYAGMVNDAHVDGMVRAFTLAIRGYRYYLDPNGASEHALNRISAGYNLPVGVDGEINLRRAQRRFNFDEHLETALRAPFGPGHRFFEQVFDVRQDGPADRNGGWVAHLRKLADRPPKTISDIKPARDGGLDHIKVPALNPLPGPHGIPGDVKLPVDRLVAYVWDREGANWRGRSMLRSLYRPWKAKDRVIRVGAINIERAGGVPYIEAPEGATPQQMKELHALATMFRVGDDAGAALPHGAQLKFASAAGGAEAINFVRLQNEEMSRALLLMFMVLGQTSSGARSLGEVLVQIADQAQQAMAKWFCGVFSEHVIEDDVDLNEGPGEEFAPLLRFQPQGDPLAPLEEAIGEAEQEGALPEDSQVAATVRAARTGVSQGARGRSAHRPFRSTSVEAAAGDTPEDRRDPLEHEQFTDWEDIEDTWVGERTALVAAWLGVREAQIAELAALIEQAAGDLDELARVEASPVGDVLIANAIQRMARYGVTTAQGEAIAQGAELPDPDLEQLDEGLAERARAVSVLLARSISEAAGRRAVERTGGSLAPSEVASEVAEHLRGLSNAYLEAQLGGALTQGFGEGRLSAMGGAPDGTRWFASALLDRSVCTPCSHDDGEEFDSLVSLQRQFPLGQNKDCEGGVRCRCTGVAIYPESAPSVE
jgi:hypothetical protein